MLSCAHLEIANLLHAKSLFKYISLFGLYSSLTACFKAELCHFRHLVFTGGFIFNLVCVKLILQLVFAYSLTDLLFVSSEMEDSFVIF